jgi:peptidoglycan/xylan/chitin deacetylase (PgdA/CDA1 family)
VNKTPFATLAGLLLTIVTGCQSLAPANVAGPSAVEPTVPVVAAPASSAAQVAPTAGGIEAAVAAAEAASAPAVCNAEASKKGYFGFYANDAWTQGNVVLTFDDGPHPTATPRVLDMLAERKLPATFFLVGRNISRDTYPMVKRMVRDGHTLASHSYSHDVTMTNVATPTETVETIRSQHEATAMLIDIALLAQSGDDFDSMFRQVFQADPAKWLTETGIRKSWRGAFERHEAMLATRGFENGARPYSVLYSRPPGGGPYVQHDGAEGIKLYDEALEKLGMMNVLWHGASGDTVPGKRSDFAFLTKNMEKYAKSGGVLLIHDYIRPDALAKSLDLIATDDSIDVMTMEQAVAHKYACASVSLGTKLSNTAADPVLPRGLFDLPSIGAKKPAAVALLP